MFCPINDSDSSSTIQSAIRIALFIPLGSGVPGYSSGVNPRPRSDQNGAFMHA